MSVGGHPRQQQRHNPDLPKPESSLDRVVKTRHSEIVMPEGKKEALQRLVKDLEEALAAAAKSIISNNELKVV